MFKLVAAEMVMIGSGAGMGLGVRDEFSRGEEGPSDLLPVDRILKLDLAVGLRCIGEDNKFRDWF